MIRLFESDANKRGNLFARLMQDLFLALGYDNISLNVPKSGREVDIQGEHRTERRRVVAECKATQEPIGGSAINKFVGVLDAERRQHGGDCVGYFISLSGFTSSALEQERLFPVERVILIDAPRIIDELQKSRLLVNSHRAVEIASRISGTLDPDVHVEPSPELGAHSIGLFWIVYFTTRKERSHFCLVHADGGALSASLVSAIVDADNKMAGSLSTLTCLTPVSDLLVPTTMEEAQAKYLDFLYSECGHINMEGLPTDQEVGTRRLILEKIYIPIHLKRHGGRHHNLPKYASVFFPETPALGNKGMEAGLASGAEWVDFTTAYARPGLTDLFGGDELLEAGSTPQDAPSSVAGLLRQTMWLGLGSERRSIGAVLQKSRRIAVLSPPGAGKSTLLKRLATAYGFPNRMRAIQDDLPERSWLPVLVRCRHLQEDSNSPITEILERVSRRAELGDLCSAFAMLLKQRLREGRVLLLIDGLDEISNEQLRVRFVTQLRTFLAMYPSTPLVVTSRVAGYRVIGSILSDHCEHFEIAEMNEQDIRQLTASWHKEVVGEADDVVIDADNLATMICRTERVRRLAANPLLLTTLLLVKRWVGQLPTRRSVLYSKAIEVLLMTWNVEAHQPIEQEEAVPQLAFVAFAMMHRGVQRISDRELREILASAREQLPEVLGYAKFSISEFISRVELRSSILTIIGHEVEDGTLQPFYEFRHLTFQEYLAARAIVDGTYANRKEDDSILSVIWGHLNEDSWKEVVPLVAVLAGRRCGPLIEELVERCNKCWIGNERILADPIASDLLSRCVGDEVQIVPQLLERALYRIGLDFPNRDGVISEIWRSRYGRAFQATVEREFASGSSVRETWGTHLVLPILGETHNSNCVHEVLDRLVTYVSSERPIEHAAGAMAVALLGTYDFSPEQISSVHSRINEKLVHLLLSELDYVKYAACRAVRQVFEYTDNLFSTAGTAFESLVTIWQRSSSEEVSTAAAWAIATFPIDSSRAKLRIPDEAVVGKFIKRQVAAKGTVGMAAAVVVGFYIQSPWSSKELAQLFYQSYLHSPLKRVLFRVTKALEALGDEGKDQLETLRRRQEAGEFN